MGELQPQTPSVSAEVDVRQAASSNPVDAMIEARIAALQQVRGVGNYRTDSKALKTFDGRDVVTVEMPESSEPLL